MPAPNTESSWRLYAYSKMCNVLFAFRLHNAEHAGSGMNTYVLHPGAIATGESLRGEGYFYRAIF